MSSVPSILYPAFDRFGILRYWTASSSGTATALCCVRTARGHICRLYLDTFGVCPHHGISQSALLPATASILCSGLDCSLPALLCRNSAHKLPSFEATGFIFNPEPPVLPLCVSSSSSDVCIPASTVMVKEESLDSSIGSSSSPLPARSSALDALPYLPPTPPRPSARRELFPDLTSLSPCIGGPELSESPLTGEALMDSLFGPDDL